MSANSIAVVGDQHEHWVNVVLPRQINEATAAAEASAKSAVQHALDAGRSLSLAKRYVPHGSWETWLTTNCTVAPRTARAYMRLFEKLHELPDEERQRVAGLPVREAIKAIATDPVAPQRNKLLGIEVRSKDHADRAATALTEIATALRAAGKSINTSRQIKPPQVKVLRNSLLAAIALLDKMQEAQHALTE